MFSFGVLTSKLMQLWEIVAHIGLSFLEEQVPYVFWASSAGSYFDCVFYNSLKNRNLKNTFWRTHLEMVDDF